MEASFEKSNKNNKTPTKWGKRCENDLATQRSLYHLQIKISLGQTSYSIACESKNSFLWHKFTIHNHQQIRTIYIQESC